MITVLVLISILAVLGGLMITAPMDSFIAQSRRAELTDEADNALQRISRELRNALPNSVRIAPGGAALEFLHTSTGGRYRAYPESGGGGNSLINGSADTFDVLDGIDPLLVDATGPAGLASCLSGGTDCLVVYNTGIEDTTNLIDDAFDAYQGDNIAAITGVTATTLSYDNNVGFSFPFPIPPSGQQRFFVVDMPISYVCSGGQIWRYQNYTITGAQPTPAGGAAITGVLPDLLANNVSDCVFDYTSGTQGGRHGLVSLSITVTDAGESVALLYQTHVANIP